MLGGGGAQSVRASRRPRAGRLAHELALEHELGRDGVDLRRLMPAAADDLRRAEWELEERRGECTRWRRAATSGEEAPSRSSGPGWDRGAAGDARADGDGDGVDAREAARAGPAAVRERRGATGAWSWSEPLERWEERREEVDA